MLWSSIVVIIVHFGCHLLFSEIFRRWHVSWQQLNSVFLSLCFRDIQQSNAVFLSPCCYYRQQSIFFFVLPRCHDCQQSNLAFSALNVVTSESPDWSLKLNRRDSYHRSVAGVGYSVNYGRAPSSSGARERYHNAPQVSRSSVVQASATAIP